MATKSLAFFLSWGALIGFSGCGVPAFPCWFCTTLSKLVVEVMTSGLPQVCKLWFGVCKGMLHVGHLAPQILMAVRLGWVVPANHIKEGTTPHPDVCKHGLQYDRRPDWRIGAWVGTWKLGSLSGRVGEVCEELRKKMIGVCCLQEMIWRGQGARMLWMKEGDICCSCLETKMELMVWELW